MINPLSRFAPFLVGEFPKPFLELLRGITLHEQLPEDELKTRLIARATVSGREDDADPVIIQNRINTYNGSTAPVEDYYKEQGKLIEINGVGSIGDITNSLFESIEITK